MLPPAAVPQIEQVLREFSGLHQRVERAERVAGGCITPAYRIVTHTGAAYFLKLRQAGQPGAGMFEAEAFALQALRNSGAVRVPEVLHVMEDRAGERAAWLLLEWLDAAPATEDGWRRLGAALALLHRVRQPAYGWAADNFIGPLPQENDRESHWASFWRERRLLPQLRRAGDAFDTRDRRRFDALFEALPELLEPAAADGASLLHGDLWSGNVLHLAGGQTALVDPSSYYGHREVDLAMAALFGGFPVAFQRAYAEEWPLQRGAEPRRQVYQLYYLLVHVNCFGGGYVASTRSALQALGF